MFPVVKVSVGGLDPKAMYSILLEFVQIDSEGRSVSSSFILIFTFWMKTTITNFEIDFYKQMPLRRRSLDS